MAALIANNNSRSSNAAATTEDWKAQAFLNLFIKKSDGTRLKIGAIPLKQQKKTDAALIQRLQQDNAIDELLKVLEVNFQMVDDDTPVDIGF